MKLSLQVALIIIPTTFTHMALVLGKSCNTRCAACWKDGQAGVDTKFYCDGGDCGSTCPPGYHGFHCADSKHCNDPNKGVVNSCNGPTAFCPPYGPCYCGDLTVNGATSCKAPCW